MPCTTRWDTIRHLIHSSVGRRLEQAGRTLNVELSRAPLTEVVGQVREPFVRLAVHRPGPWSSWAASVVSSVARVSRSVIRVA
ncbi:hypothetical protein ACVW19_005030 [Streptomyces sp. TE5632]